MQNSKETIDTLLTEIEHLHARGEYVKFHARAMKMLERCSADGTDPHTYCRVLLAAARSAYCVSRFDESIGLLESLAAFVGTREIPGRRVVELESAIITANVRRRRGDLEGALAALEPFRTCTAPEYPLALVAERLLVEGACWFYRNELRAAEEALEAALGIAIHCADARARARVLLMLGLISQGKGLPEAAVEYLDRAKEIAFAAGDAYGEAAASLNMGIVLYRRGRFTEAERVVARARSVFARIEWHIGVCRSDLALGNIAKGRRSFAEAMRAYRSAGDLADGRGFGRESALALEFMGEIHFERGRYGRAEECYARGLELARTIAPHGDVEMEIQRRLGELALERGASADALGHLRLGLRLAQRLGDRLEKGAVLRCMAKAAFRAGALERGASLARKAIETLDGAGCDLELGKTRLTLAELLLERAGSAAGRTRDDHAPSMIDEAWKNAVEAGHILGAIDSEDWRRAAERCIDAVAAVRKPAAPPARATRAGAAGVTLRHSADAVLHGGFIAVSPQMMRLWEQIQFASRFMRPVLITGETGTGKELVARIIHALGERAGRGFVPVNCAAIPDHLFESEFFGHRRGCFTGALTDRRGLFEEAHGGTLFLDEIGELTTLQQVKLLRALQEGRVRRVGENVERPVDVRIISATNQNLEEKLGQAALREDFLYRINAEHIHVPPIRERREDILPLVSFFLCSGGAGGDAGIAIEPSALACLERYPWPGNVREMFAVLDRVRHMSGGGAVKVDMLPEKIREAGGLSASRSPACAAAGGFNHESELRSALQLCGGNKSAAAKRLGISRGTLYKEMRRLGLAHMIARRGRPAGTSSLFPQTGGPTA